jgi:hypothetical protein
MAATTSDEADTVFCINSNLEPIRLITWTTLNHASVIQFDWNIDTNVIMTSCQHQYQIIIGLWSNLGIGIIDHPDIADSVAAAKKPLFLGNWYSVGSKMGKIVKIFESVEHPKKPRGYLLGRN